VKISKILLISAFLLSLLGGCATAPSVKPAPPSDAPKRFYVNKANEAEAKGNAFDALRFYKMALTVDPQDEALKTSISRIEKELKEAARRHFEAGMKFREEGNYFLARKEFLNALRFDPDFQEAYRMLTDKSQVVTKKYVVHVVRPGESISKLAQIYYGDYKKYPIIARFNGLEDAASVMVGQQLKIPVEEGFKERPKEEGEKPAQVKESYEVLESADDEFFAVAGVAQTPPAEAKGDKKEEEQDQATGYRNYAMDLFQQQRYDEAAVEFEKVLAVLPYDKVAREYAYKANYESALLLLKEKEYLAARDRFKMSLTYNSECSKCHTYIRECEDSYKEFHYRNGMKLFQDQNVQEALKEWEMVSSLDPNYKRTPQLIERAKTILKKLEELKKTR
jgi:tetratricopeptide (TPR) repeat protein